MFQTLIRRSIGILMSLLLFGCSDTVRTSYVTFEELQKTNSTAKLWLPEFLPSSAFNIWEEHNIDTNTVTGEFDCKPEDLSKVTMSLERITGQAAVRVHQTAMKISGRIKPAVTYDIFGWKADVLGVGYVVVNNATGSVLFWTERVLSKSKPPGSN